MLFLLSGLLAGHQPSNYARDLDAVTTFSAAARSNVHSMQRDKQKTRGVFKLTITESFWQRLHSDFELLAVFS